MREIDLSNSLMSLWEGAKRARDLLVERLILEVPTFATR